MARVHAQRLAGGQLVPDHFTGQLSPGAALAADALQDEALTAEHARGEGLLETGRDLDAGAAGEEPMPVNHVVAAGSDIDRQDAARHFGGERDDPRRSLRGVGAHQQSPSADLALQRSHQPLSAYTAAHAGGHLDGVGHPGELADLGDDALTPVERNRQHRHGRAENLVLHNRSFSGSADALSGSADAPAGVREYDRAPVAGVLTEAVVVRTSEALARSGSS